jgi:hypothetical protein
MKKKPAVKMASVKNSAVKNNEPIVLANTFVASKTKDIVEKIKKPTKPNNKPIKEIPKNYYKIVLPCCKTTVSKAEYIKKINYDTEKCFICNAPYDVEANKEIYGYSLKMILDNLPPNVLIEDVYILNDEDGPGYSDSIMNLAFAKIPNIDKEIVQYEKDLLAYETYKLKEASAKLEQEKKKLEEKLNKLNN